MPRKVEFGALYGVLVDWGCYEHIDVSVLKVLDGTFERSESGCTGSGAFNARFHLGIVVKYFDEVVVSAFNVVSVVDYVEWHIFKVNHLAVKCGNSRRAVKHWGAKFANCRLRERFQDYFISYSVDIPVGDSNAYFFIVAHLLFYC